MAQTGGTGGGPASDDHRADGRKERAHTTGHPLLRAGRPGPGTVSTDSNYRIYDKEALERLRFIGQCRSLGFSLSEIRALCGITEAQTWTCAQVESVVRQHLDLTEEKIGELLDIRGVLAEKMAQCSGEQASACKFLEQVQQGDDRDGEYRSVLPPSMSVTRRLG